MNDIKKGVKMQKLLMFSFLVLAIAFVSGCATLGEIAAEIPSMDASAEVAAVSTLTSDIVNQPWDNLLQVGLGYVLALLRIMYKKKKGMK